MSTLLCPRCQQQWTRAPLTRRQAEVLAFVERYIAEHRYAPSYGEIGAHFGFRSPATVHEHLGELQRKGHIVRQYNEARSIRLVSTDQGVAA